MDALFMLKALSISYKKPMNAIINEIIRDAFDREDRPLTKIIKKELESSIVENVDKTI